MASHGSIAMGRLDNDSKNYLRGYGKDRVFRKNGGKK